MVREALAEGLLELAHAAILYLPLYYEQRAELGVVRQTARSEFFHGSTHSGASTNPIGRGFPKRASSSSAAARWSLYLETIASSMSSKRVFIGLGRRRGCERVSEREEGRRRQTPHATMPLGRRAPWRGARCERSGELIDPVSS